MNQLKIYEMTCEPSPSVPSGVLWAGASAIDEAVAWFTNKYGVSPTTTRAVEKVSVPRFTSIHYIHAKEKY